MLILYKSGKCLLRLICVFLVSLIPKDKSIWVFGAWLGKAYSDNPKYMYQYVSSLRSSEITPIWIAKEAELVLELKKKGINAYKHNSLIGMYYQIVSQVVFVGHSISSDLNHWVISFNTKRVQLWHGIPLKKIGFDDHIFTTKKTWVQKYPKLFSLLTNDSYDLVTSTGNTCTKLFSSAFNIPINKIVATGFPRNDVFYMNPQKHTVENVYKVIYMPTFRGSIGEHFDLFENFGFKADEFEIFFEKNNIELTIRTHPANKPSDNIISAIMKSKRLHLSTISDIYEEIANFDCLITDYSSVLFDFSLSNKPILFAPFDLDNYLVSDRELYFEYNLISNSIHYYNWVDLLTAILNAKNNKLTKSSDFIRAFHENPIKEEFQYSAQVYKYIVENILK